MKRYAFFMLFVLLFLCCFVSCGARHDPPRDRPQGTAEKTLPSTPPEPLYEAKERMCLRYIEGYYEYYPEETGKNSRCFFLPANTDLSALKLYVNLPEGCVASADGKELKPGYSVFDISETMGMNVNFTGESGRSYSVNYTFKKSSVTSLYIWAYENLGSVDAMNADKDHNTYCYGAVSFSGGDNYSSFESYMSLRGRGNATWTDEKKGYALYLFDDPEFSEKRKTDICEMGASDKWILTANHRDRTLVRNALAYTLAERLGMKNAIEFVFTDLYINGEYRGLYILSEKIDRERVGIPLAKEDGLDGGYLLEFDNYDDEPQFKLKKSKMRVTVCSPSSLSSYTEIEKFLNSAEDAVMSPLGTDPSSGKSWYDFIDISSFAKLWIVREYSMDYDANVNFHLYYDPADGKLHAGPAWDFDNSFARTTGIYADPDAALIESGDRNSNCWLTKLMNFTEFREEIVRIYKENRDLFISNSENSIYSLAITLRETIKSSADMNFTVWRDQLYYKSWNYSEDMSYSGHYRILLDFIKERNKFWEKYIPGLTE